MIHHQTDTITLHHGDCIEVLVTLPDASVDAVVTDPPYGLEFMGRDWDAPWKASSVGRGARVSTERAAEMTEAGRGHSTSAGPYLPARVDSVRVAGAPFQAWCEQWAAECLRVLKPGGHMVAFGGTRTFHRLTAGIEDAGFEIRDVLTWLYGSGFPKSMDVSKAIDKRRTEDLESVRAICRAVRAALDVRDLKSRHLVEHFDGCHPRLIDHWAARDTDSQPSLPTWEQWETLTALFGELAEHDAEVWRLNGRKGTPGEAWEAREVTGTVDEWADRVNYALTSRDGLRRDNPSTPDARQWQGWGTALKPAWEPIVLARKPLAGTVAANVLAHGTGALNIDACRIGFRESRSLNRTASIGYGGSEPQGMVSDGGAGRFPANVLMDAEAGALLDEQSGDRPSSGGAAFGRGGYGGTVGLNRSDRREIGFGDSGGASRFFYSAKADATARPVIDGTAHPTVKPLALMEWLIRLVTPPGGTVLEPFAGSGTTLEAAQYTGHPAVGIEQGDEYLPLIVHRLERTDPRIKGPKPIEVHPDQMDLLSILT